MPVLLAVFFILTGTLISTWLTFITYKKLYTRTTWKRHVGTVIGYVPIDAEEAVGLSYRYVMDGQQFTGSTLGGSTDFKHIRIGTEIGILVNPANHAESDKDDPLYFWTPIMAFCFGVTFVAAGIFGLLYPNGWPG